MKETTKGIISINLSSVLMGGTTLFAKLITMSVPSIIFDRSVIAIFALLIFIFSIGKPVKIYSKKEAFILLGLGLLMTLHWISLFYSIQISTVAVGMISLFTYPVITVFLEPLFFNEKTHPRDILIALIVFGGILLIIPEFTISNNITKGVLFGILSALIFAVRNIIQRKYMSHFPGTTIMFYQVIIIVVILFPFMDLKAIIPNRLNLIYLVILGIFFTALPHSMLSYSLSILKAKSVSIISSMQPLYATILSVIILQEIPSLNTIIGGIFITACAMYESIRLSHE